ncbi:uncharacterized protein [Pyrus communis]|uniref:uncharacterized protein n=1 Tax=Pyrus communis TaxID=23211 RepID=UPI0035BF648F
MDPPHGSRPWRPCLLHHPHHHLHHHHHHHPLFLCPLHHRHRHQVHHFHHLRTNFASFPQNPEPPAAAATPFPTHLNSEPSELKEEYYDDPTAQTLPEYGEIDDGGLEEEEDDEPVFVLTDEWKEFFAKSEAKRKLENQQAKRKGKARQSQE